MHAFWLAHNLQVRRQLEYQIYRDSHPEMFHPLPPSSAGYSLPNNSLAHPAGTSASIPEPPIDSSKIASSSRPRPPPFAPPSTMQAVKMIVNASGLLGLYTGWRLHFIRDMSGTALYFAEYDVMRHTLGRKRVNELTERDFEDTALRDMTRYADPYDLVQGEVPDWARMWLPKGAIPFLCGSIAGVTSWALIYPVDVSQAAQLNWKPLIFIGYQSESLHLSSCSCLTTRPRRNSELYPASVRALPSLNSCVSSVVQIQTIQSPFFVAWPACIEGEWAISDCNFTSAHMQAGNLNDSFDAHPWFAMDHDRLGRRLDRDPSLRTMGRRTTPLTSISTTIKCAYSRYIEGLKC